MTSPIITRPRGALRMSDRLSHLALDEACRLAGNRALLIAGGAVDWGPLEALRIEPSRAVLAWNDPRSNERGEAHVHFAHNRPGRLEVGCSCAAGDAGCVHLGGLFSYVLEEKTELGLARPPRQRAEWLSPAELTARAIAEREARARDERMTIRSSDESEAWVDYTVTSTVSGKTYRVALRGTERGVSYCTCPDYKTNTLGTCKHVMKVLALAKKQLPRAKLAAPYPRTRVTVHVRYGDVPVLAVALPHDASTAVRDALAPLLAAAAPGLVSPSASLRSGPALVRAGLQALALLGQPAFVTPDAEELMGVITAREKLAALVAEVRAGAAHHPLRHSLLREPLLPYQLEGVAFAAGAGRAVLADDMGLGKTIQGIGVAELLARELGIRKVLLVCPASLKAQWRSEIARFSTRTAQVVTGHASERAAAYESEAFFTITNYEQVLRDILVIEREPWDLVILDEGQRIKNWEAKTTRVVKGLVSRHALVLTGTPLENRLDDLFSIVAFIDPHALGPSFRFFPRHRTLDEEGKLVGYQNLDDLRARLAPVLLRRTRASVRLELPERTTDIVRITPTAEQRALHTAHMRIVRLLLGKKFLTEVDLLRLRASLLMCRMAANDSFLVTKTEPSASSKLERLGILFDAVADDPTRKVVLFSEWTTMLDRIEPLLHARQLSSVRLDGDVPQKKRQALVDTFTRDGKCRVFLTTNAGSTGLNLQAANTVINVDLPWNPAVLEQRIARAHRMGQCEPVHAYVLITEDTLEEQLLASLAAKQDLALAALDPDCPLDHVTLAHPETNLKARLEELIGAQPDAPVHQRSRIEAERENERASLVR